MAFDRLIEQFARNLARQVADQFEAAIGDELDARASSIVGRHTGGVAVKGRRGRPPGSKNRKSTKGMKRNMDCRVCGKRSMGPGSRYLCEEHLKLPKKEQDAAIAKWKEAHKA